MPSGVFGLRGSRLHHGRPQGFGPEAPANFAQISLRPAAGCSEWDRRRAQILANIAASPAPGWYRARVPASPAPGARGAAPALVGGLARACCRTPAAPGVVEVVLAGVLLAGALPASSGAVVTAAATPGL